MLRDRKINNLACSILIGLCLASCAKTPSPVLNTQLNTIQLLQRIEEFQDTVIDLYSQSQVSPEHARLYVTFSVSATKTVKQLPNGWQATVKSGWTQLLSQLPLDKMELKVQVAAKLLDTLINSL